MNTNHVPLHRETEQQRDALGRSSANQGPTKRGPVRQAGTWARDALAASAIMPPAERGPRSASWLNCPGRHRDLKATRCVTSLRRPGSERPQPPAAARALLNRNGQKALIMTTQEPRPTDAREGTWTRLKLMRMNARFVAAMERALAEEEERASTALISRRPDANGLITAGCLAAQSARTL